MKKIVRLTESDLHKIIKESVKKVLRETITHHTLPSGGFDSAAFQFDRAFEDAQSEEEWDEMMDKRQKHLERAANNALYLHPQAQNKFGSINAKKYVNPENYNYNPDNILKSFEDDVIYNQKERGF